MAASISLPPEAATDLTIRELAAIEASLTDEVRELTADARAYRELALAACAALNSLTQTFDQAKVTILAQREELRRYTAAHAAPGRAV
ncbi:MAG: hypothetical protein NT151_11800 [Acidobacteria bacterium]|nr:hypothetical protein [Acidobacteriota bacterium]